MIGNVTTGLGNVLTAGAFGFGPNGGGGGGGAAAFLSADYAAGLASADPDAANTLVGDLYNLFFDDHGGLSVLQAAEAPIGTNDFSPLTVLRWAHDPFNSLVSQYYARNGQSDRSGGLTEEFFTQKAEADGTIDSTRKFANRRLDLQSNVAFDALRGVSGMLAQYNVGLIIPADESLHENIFQLTGYGSVIARPITSGGVHRQGVFYADPFGTANPANGYQWGFWVNKIGQYNLALDNYDSGSGHADSHAEIRVGSIAGATDDLLAASFGLSTAEIVGDLALDGGCTIADTLVCNGGVSVPAGNLSVTGDVAATTFNGSPLPTGGITQLTGDVTAGPGSGSQAATIGNDKVTNAKLANMADSTVKGVNVGSGTSDPVDLTMTQLYNTLFPIATSGAAGGAVTDLSVTLPASPSGRWKIWGNVIALLNGGGATGLKGQINSSSATIENFGQTQASTYVDTTCDVLDGRTDKDVTGTFSGTLTYVSGVKSFVDIGCTGTTSAADTQGNREATIWNNTAAPTTWRLHSTVASKIGTGSQIWAQAL